MHANILTAASTLHQGCSTTIDRLTTHGYRASKLTLEDLWTLVTFQVRHLMRPLWSDQCIVCHSSDRLKVLAALRRSILLLELRGTRFAEMLDQLTSVGARGCLVLGGALYLDEVSTHPIALLRLLLRLDEVVVHQGDQVIDVLAGYLPDLL